MVETYKLVFDLALYFTLSGYYLIIGAHVGPSAPGFLALCAAAGLDAILRTRGVYGRRQRFLRLLPLFLPLSAFFLRPALWQALQLIPAWIYLGWSVLTDRVSLRYDGFRTHFSFGLRALLLLAFGPIFSPQFGGALLRSVPYLVLMLGCGVCLLRMLREARAEGMRQGVYIAVFVFVCAGLTVGKAPQLLVKAAGYLWRYALAPLIFVAALAFAALFYGAYLLLRWLVLRAQGKSEPLNIDARSAAQMMGLEDQYDAYTANLEWLRWLLLVLAVCILVFFLIRFFRRLMGEKVSTAGNVSPWRETRGAASKAVSSPHLSGLMRPREPRLAVRYYYARFLAECRRRGLAIPDGSTVTELCKTCAPGFPGADPSVLCELYSPARYSDRSAVSPSDARRAAETWKELKRSPAPGEAKSRQNHRKIT